MKKSAYGSGNSAANEVAITTIGETVRRDAIQETHSECGRRAL